MASVLIAEDQKEVQDIIIEPLEIKGHEVDVADNGKIALDMLTKKKYQVLITDIIMPGMTGLTLIKEVRKIQPNIKVIAISGGGRVNSDDYLKSAEHVGADATFTKPFDLFALASTITKLTHAEC